MNTVIGIGEFRLFAINVYEFHIYLYKDERKKCRPFHNEYVTMKTGNAFNVWREEMSQKHVGIMALALTRQRAKARKIFRHIQKDSDRLASRQNGGSKN